MAVTRREWCTCNTCSHAHQCRFILHMLAHAYMHTRAHTQTNHIEYNVGGEGHIKEKRISIVLLFTNGIKWFPQFTTASRNYGFGGNKLAQMFIFVHVCFNAYFCSCANRIYKRFGACIFDLLAILRIFSDVQGNINSKQYKHQIMV